MRAIWLAVMLSMSALSTPAHAQELDREEILLLRENPKTARASAWIGGYLGTLFLFNGYILRPPDWDPPKWSQFKQAFTMPPELNDDDGWHMNLVLHPIMGAHWYMAARNHGHTHFTSWLMVTGGIVTWEWLVESWFTRPVVVDTVATSLLSIPFAFVLSQVKKPIRRIDDPLLRSYAMMPFDPVEGLDGLVFQGPPITVRF